MRRQAQRVVAPMKNHKLRPKKDVAPDLEPRVGALDAAKAFYAKSVSLYASLKGD